MTAIGFVTALSLVVVLATVELRRVAREQVAARMSAGTATAVVVLAAGTAVLVLPRFLDLVS